MAYSPAFRYWFYAVEKLSHHKMIKAFVVIVTMVFSRYAVAQWEKTLFPSSDFSNAVFYVHDHSLFVSLDGFTTLYRSQDDGAHWVNIHDSLPKEKRVESIIYTGKYLLASMFDWNPDSTVGRCYRSTDDGNTWQLTTGNGKDIAIIYALADFNTFLLGAYGQNSIVMSTDNGDNWVSIVDTLEGYGVTKFLLDGNHLYAAENNGGGIYCSTDTGRTWRRFNNQLSYTDITDIISAGHTLFASALQGLWYSTDSAKHWKNYSDTIKVTSLSKTNNLLFASGDNIYCSLDTGNVWIDITGNLPVYRSFIGTNDKYIFAGSGGEIWRRPLSDFTNAVHQNPPPLLTLSVLSNPVTSSADFEFSALHDQQILELFDMLGRSVLRQQLEAGEFRLYIDMEKYPAGIYVARLGTESVKLIKK
jgi:photosystem II stability/assembly factor-like uncharacterized protein